jgi:hypothetical protein
MKQLKSPDLIAILTELEPACEWGECRDPVRQAAAQAGGVRCNAHQPAQTGPLVPPLEVTFFPLTADGAAWRTCSATGRDLRAVVKMALAGYRSGDDPCKG